MKCPACESAKQRVLHTRSDEHRVMRLRCCIACGHRWATTETEVHSAVRVQSTLSIEPAYLERGSAATFLAISESTLEKLVREGDLPRPRQVSGKRVAWLVRELRDWAETRPVSDLLPVSGTASRRAL